jgi:hypothetical protein
MAKQARINALPWQEQLIERGKEALRNNPAFSSAMWAYDNRQTIADAVGWAKELFDATRGKSRDELLAATQRWLEEKFGTLTCAMVDALAAMAGSDTSMAEQLGEIKAIADAQAIEIGAALLVDVALTKGRAVYATKIAPALSRGLAGAGTLVRGVVSGGSRTAAGEVAGGAALRAEQAAARSATPAPVPKPTAAPAPKPPPAPAKTPESTAAGSVDNAAETTTGKPGSNVEGERRDGQAEACMGCP